MASTLTKKRSRKTRVGDLTTDEFEALLDRKLAQWAGDPRVLRRRQEIAAHAEQTRAEHRAGKTKRGTAHDLLADMD